MVGEQNLSELAGELVDSAVPILIEKVDFLTPIFGAIGFAVAIYIIYLIIRIFLTWKHRKRLERVEKKVDLIDKKLDLLLGKKNNKNNKK